MTLRMRLFQTKVLPEEKARIGRPTGTQSRLARLRGQHALQRPEHDSERKKTGRRRPGGLQYIVGGHGVMDRRQG